MGLADTTTRVQPYCREAVKEDSEAAAEQQGDTSLSQSLNVLIREAHILCILLTPVSRNYNL